MPLQVTPYSIPLAATGLGLGGFGIYLLWRSAERRTREATLAAFLLLGMAAWLLTYTATLTATTRAGKLLFARLQYVGPAAVPPLWLAFVLTYTGHGDAIDRVRATALAIPPVSVFLLALSFPRTRLVWRSVELVDVGSWVAMVVTHGPGFYAYQVYIYTLFVVSVWVLVHYYRRATGVYRRQTLVLLFGALVPGIVGLVYIAGLNPAPALDLPAVSLTVTAVAVAWSVVRDDLFTLAPVAWETAVTQLADPVFVVDADDRVVAANDAGRTFADIEVGAPATETLGEVFDAPYWRHVGDHEFNAFRDGGQRVYEVSVAPVERGDSRAGTLVVVRDVTERMRREERLEEFASVVSHDLRNPLNVARGHLELGRETGDDHHFEEVDDALDRMERIIDDLLTLAREGDADPDAEDVSLADAAYTAWGAVDTLDANATLDVVEDRSLVADETALLRLFENLFRNSVEHGSTTPTSHAQQDAVEHGSTSNQNAQRSGDAVEHSSTSPGSGARQDADEHGGDAVTVTVGATDDGFFVADDGPGIPADERDDVFEHGYTTSDDGTGFGLAIVEEVAATHGWQVSVTDSEAGGARFEFTVA